MLVLTRQEGQSIEIGNDIVVKIGKISGGQVKVLIEAPKEITILRSELTRRDPVDV